MATGIDEWGEPDEGAYLRPDEEASVKRGLAQSAAGETADLGDFTQYIEHIEPEERPGWAPGISPAYGEWMASSD